MQHPDLNYTAVSYLQAARREKAELRRRLRAATNEEAGRARPAWLDDLGRCVEEPAAEVVVVIDLQGAVLQRPADVHARRR